MQKFTTTIPQAIANAKELEKENKDKLAVEIYSQIINKHPTHVESILNRAKLYSKNHKYKESIIDYKKLLSITKNKVALPKYLILSSIADNYLLDRNPLQAIKYIDYSIIENPLHETNYIVKLNLLKHMNNLTENHIAQIENKIDKLQKTANIFYLKAKIAIAKKDPTEQIKDYLNKALTLAPHPQIKYLVLSELANIAKQQQLYSDAFNLMQESNIISKQMPSHQKYIKHSKTLDSFIEKSNKWKTTDNPKINLESNCKYSPPIFLIGFPRSGTTLAEQILSTRDKTIVTDELGIIDYITQNHHLIIGRQLAYPEEYTSLQNDEINALRIKYYEKMEEHFKNIPSDTTIIDKNPYAIIYLGLINKLFPSSKIIMMIRDPRDVCISCFFQIFEPNASNLHFHSLEDTITYYNNIMSLYFNFKKQFPEQIIEVKYEDLCNNFEDSTKKLLNEIDKKWDSKIIDFYKQKRFITTPSHDAVSKPINSKAIGNWKNYEKQISPYLSRLKPFLKEFCYE